MTLRGFFRRSLAGVLSLLMAGLGQTFNRQPKKGIAFLLLIPAVVCFLWSTRLSRTFDGFIFNVFLNLGIVIWAMTDAFVCGGREARHRTGFRAAPVWFLCAILLVALNGFGALTGFYQSHAMSGFRAFVYPSASMSPTLIKGDRFVSNMRYYEHHEPTPGDVVIVQNISMGSLIITRIIAIGGDIIESDGRSVSVNGEKLREPYAWYALPSTPDSKEVFGPIKIPAERYFVMGDNRDNSFDSRYFGSIALSQIKGHPLFVYWSHDRSRIGQTIR